MKTTRRSEDAETRSSVLRICLKVWTLAQAALFSFVVSGCASGGSSPASLASSYRPSNVHQAVQRLPSHIRRVAVLPVSVETGDWQAEEGATDLAPVLYAELGKVKAFELVAVSPERMRQWTGKACWSAEEKLPPDLFEHLADALGCDAVLFVHLRPYHAYPPLAVGWNFKLVAAKAKSVLWSADEVFDSAEATVAKAAEEYGRDHVEGLRPLGDAGGVLNSPRRFSQFTLSALLGTLPAR